MKSTDQLRLAGIVVLVLLVAVLFFLKSPSESGPASIPGRTTPASVSRTAADGSTWTLDRAGGGMLVETDPNGPKAGPPILVKTDVVRTGPAVSIGLILEGQTGEHYQPVVKKNGNALSAPTVRIVNEAGQVVAQGSFQYGWGGTCRYSWRVPNDFTGKFQVQVGIDLGPIEVQHDQPWHSL